MEEWAIKIVYMWNEKIRDGSFMYIQKHYWRCVSAYIIHHEWLVFFSVFPYQNHWALLIFTAKAAKLRSRDMEIGHWKNIKWLKNIVLTRVVQTKKKNLKTQLETKVIENVNILCSLNNQMFFPSWRQPGLGIKGLKLLF